MAGAGADADPAAQVGLGALGAGGGILPFDLAAEAAAAEAAALAACFQQTSLNMDMVHLLTNHWKHASV